MRESCLPWHFIHFTRRCATPLPSMTWLLACCMSSHVCAVTSVLSRPVLPCAACGPQLRAVCLVQPPEVLVLHVQQTGWVGGKKRGNQSTGHAKAIALPGPGEQVFVPIMQAGEATSSATSSALAAYKLQSAVLVEKYADGVCSSVLPGRACSLQPVFLRAFPEWRSLSCVR